MFVIFISVPSADFRDGDVFSFAQVEVEENVGLLHLSVKQDAVA